MHKSQFDTDPYEVMLIEDRAKRLVGDMPWITEKLTEELTEDLIHQIHVAFKAVAWQSMMEERLREAGIPVNNLKGTINGSATT